MQLHAVPHCSISVISGFLRLRYLDGVFLSYFLDWGFVGGRVAESVLSLPCDDVFPSCAWLCWRGLCLYLFPADSFLLGFCSGSSAGLSLSEDLGQVFSLSCPLRSRSWNTDVGSHQNGPIGSTHFGGFPVPGLGTGRLGLFIVRVNAMHCPVTSKLSDDPEQNMDRLLLIYF